MNIKKRARRGNCQAGSSRSVETPTLDALADGSFGTGASGGHAKRAIQEMAATLQSLLGQQIVAYIVWNRGSESGWPLGAGRSDPAARDGAAACVLPIRSARLLALADSPDTARAWFIGMNPHFADRAPFAILGEQPAQAQRVLAAAKSFVVGS